MRNGIKTFSGKTSKLGYKLYAGAHYIQVNMGIGGNGKNTWITGYAMILLDMVKEHAKLMVHIEAINLNMFVNNIKIHEHYRCIDNS